MDVKIIVPTGTDISKIETEYPDIYQDDTDCDGDDIYFVGKSSDDEDNDRDSESEWLTYDEAVECSGFVEGAIDGAITCIEGNGAWAMGMLQRTDFTGYAVSAADIDEYKRCSDIWHKAYERGKSQVKN